MDDCILWWGNFDKQGYGVATHGRAWLWGTVAHRRVYEACFGLIPPGMQIDHLCNNPSCVNPAHLEVVTPKENARRRGMRRTVCKRGHPRTSENTIVRNDGTATCKICIQLRKSA